MSVLVAGGGAASAAATVAGGPWSRPVVGPVVRGYDPPDSLFGPGHVGVDFAVAAGSAVRAAGDGTVVFAGRVGTGLHVVVRHAGDVRTTDSFLATIVVVAGQAVMRGAIVGTSGGTGPGHGPGVLHFGVRVGDRSIDPMLLFAPPDLAAVVHLAEPRGGATASPPPADDSQDRMPPGSVGRSEWAALAASVRLDAIAAVGPPSWWGSGDPAPVVTRTDPSRLTREVALDHPASFPPPPTLIAFGSAAGVGAAVAARRRRVRRAS
jgi:hypothetical protein